jgi:hypothetical protein
MIKFERDELTHELSIVLGKNGNTFIHATNDWKQLAGKSKYNWYSFHLINAYFENDIICPGFEIEITFLGLGLRFRHNRNWKDIEMQSRINSMKEAIEIVNLIPGGFSGNAEFTDELRDTLKSLISMTRKGMTEQELIEQLSDAEHDSWARWMQYLFTRCIANPDKSATIPADLVERWMRQAYTIYDDLSEQEKQSDRDEVAHILPIIKKYTEESETVTAEEKQLDMHQWARDLTEEEVKSLNNIFYGEERDNRS